MKDMIILLPGIMGSILQHNGRDLWAISGQSIFDFIRTFGGNVQNLELKGDDYTVEALRDGVTSTALIPDTVSIPGFWKIGGYTKISQMIQTKFDVIKGRLEDTNPANYYDFHYDWRRDNCVAARRLRKLIERQLKIWRDHCRDQSAKVILIAHSMGGLISRHYLEVEGGWQDCRMLITFGTPYRGSLKALDYLANGYKNVLVDSRNILRSMTSVYQLLPVYKSVRINRSFKRIAEIDNLPNIDQAHAREARAFHTAIKEAVEVNKTEQDYKDKFSIVPIVGNEQSTLQSGELITVNRISKLQVTNQLPNNDLPKNVDGTVPLISSIPYEIGIDMVRPFIEQHGTLQNNNQVLRNVEFLLEHIRTGIISLEYYGLEEQRAGINLELEDLFLTGEPITMTAQLINSATILGKLNGVIQNIDNPESVYSEIFIPDDNKWKLVREPLPSGRYRIKVEPGKAGTGISPVHGLFEVAN